MPTTLPSASRRMWIDVALAVAGLALTVRGLPAVGVPLAAFSLVAPLLRLRQGRRGTALLGLVPSELAEAHQLLVAAAALPGVVDGPDAITAADDALLEAAVLLVGRAPRGAAQKRFVSARVVAMRDTAELLRERHHAVAEATRELEALAPTAPASPTAEPPGPGVLVRIVAVALMPAFLLWDMTAGLVKAIAALVEGILLRLRATGRVALVLLRSVGVVAVEARASWHVVRRTFAESARSARRSTTSLRLRTQLEMRRLRRRFRVTL